MRLERIALIAALLFVARSVNASSAGSRVAIVFSDGAATQSGLGRDLPLEFRAEGFDVHVMHTELDVQSVDDWAERARSDDDVAMVHVAPGAAGDALIEILLVTPSSLVLKDTIHYVPSDTSDIASVRAVEVTRAALLEAAAPRERTPPRFEIDETEKPAPESESRPFALVFSPHVALMGSAPLAQLGLGAGASWSLTSRTVFEVEGAFPIGRSSEGTSDGTVFATATLFTAGVSYYFAPPRYLLRPFGGIRVGAALFTTDASAYGPFLGEKATTVAFFGAAAFGVSMRLYDFLRLRGSVTVGFSVPQLALRVNGQEADRLGLPVMLLQIGPEVTW